MWNYNLGWSKIEGTEVDLEAYLQMNNNLCDYHNNNHIESMYAYLERQEYPYDPALDWAIKFHDVVYDNLPEKEKRSADLFMKWSSKYRGCNLSDEEKDRVYNLIMCTKDHVTGEKYIEGDMAIILADLHQLANTKDVITNYSKIMTESMKLYGIDEFEFAKNNLIFMEALADRINRDYEPYVIDVQNQFRDIIKGIRLTISISESILNTRLM
jgi:predicted metal-dependent HD superfamily phosphohydrolase